MNRREFITRAAQAAGGLALGGYARLLQAKSLPIPKLNFAVPPSPDLPQMVIATGNSPRAMAQSIVEALGGIGRFVKAGDRVIIKPNVAFDASPKDGADTHPEIVGAITAMAVKAGAKKVIVLDNTLGEPKRCFAVSGIAKAAIAAGGEILFQQSRNFSDIELGNRFGQWPIFSEILSADKLINVPVVKQHGLSKMTASMKNLYGVLGGNRGRLHQRIDASIVTLAKLMPPTLVILDAYRVMVSNGPSGGRADDLIHPRTIAAGTDQVALDTFAASFLGLKAVDVDYLTLAEKEGLGTIRYQELRQKRIGKV